MDFKDLQRHLCLGMDNGLTIRKPPAMSKILDTYKCDMERHILDRAVWHERSSSHSFMNTIQARDTSKLYEMIQSDSRVSLDPDEYSSPKDDFIYAAMYYDNLGLTDCLEYLDDLEEDTYLYTVDNIKRYLQRKILERRIAEYDGIY